MKKSVNADLRSASDSRQNFSRLVTIGYSTHRLESLAFAARLMQSHDALFLEEPPTPGFRRMLQKELSIEDYLMRTDTEYPEFATGLCRILRDLHLNGKAIFQVEPFIEELLKIHDFFADGGTPEQIPPGTVLYDVYQAEKRATQKLLNFYRASVGGQFENNIDAVKKFAQSDAARFRLRDKLRAGAISSLASRFSSIYVEAGEIHALLLKELKTAMGSESKITPTYLLAPVYEKFSGKRRLFAPGDILTIHYIFHPAKDSRKLNLLAAQSLIYSKILLKEEIIDSIETYPHTKDEIETIQKVNSLTFKDCEAIFSKIRFTTSRVARKIVDEFIFFRTNDK